MTAADPSVDRTMMTMGPLYVRVRAGDTPVTIADRFGYGDQWRALVAANPTKTMRGETFYTLTEGERLLVPSGWIGLTSRHGCVVPDFVEGAGGVRVGVGDAPDPGYVPPDDTAMKLAVSIGWLGLCVGGAWVGTKLAPKHPVLGGAAGALVGGGAPIALIVYAVAKSGF